MTVTQFHFIIPSITSCHVRVNDNQLQQNIFNIRLKYLFKYFHDYELLSL